jgi:hypothetical protein
MLGVCAKLRISCWFQSNKISTIELPLNVWMFSVLINFHSAIFTLLWIFCFLQVEHHQNRCAAPMATFIPAPVKWRNELVHAMASMPSPKIRTAVNEPKDLCALTSAPPKKIWSVVQIVVPTWIGVCCAFKRVASEWRPCRWPMWELALTAVLSVSRVRLTVKVHLKTVRCAHPMAMSTILRVWWNCSHAAKVS